MYVRHTYEEAKEITRNLIYPETKPIKSIKTQYKYYILVNK